MTAVNKIGKFKIRRDTSFNWATKNPVLRDGEQAWDTTEKKMKIGDGTTPWLQLNFTTDFLENQISTKADHQTTNERFDAADAAIAEKVSLTNFNDFVSATAVSFNEIDDALGGKVNQDAFNNALTTLAAKANTSEVNTALALKADKTYVDNGLSAKADAVSTSQALAAKLNAANPNFTGTINGGAGNFSGATSAATVNGLQIKDDQSTAIVTQIINKPGQFSFAFSNSENASTAIEFGVWDTASLRANGVKIAASPTTAQLQGKIASRILFFFGNSFTASGANYFDTNTLGTDTQKLFTVKNNGTEKFGVLGNGDLTIQGLKVVTARQTGWTAATGTANKGAFDTETATLADATRRIKALEDVLRVHGLIN